MQMEIQDKYCKTAPSAQNAIDIFKDNWTTSYTAAANVVAGSMPLANDSRIAEMIARLGGSLAGRTLVELGPFECGHTKMLHDAGADMITAIEGNSICYLKSLIIKEVLNLERVRLKFGEIEAWLQEAQERVDLIVASGVLYHFKDPLLALLRITEFSNNVFIWTHYMDSQAMPATDPRRGPFTGQTELRRIDGFESTYHFRTYEGAENNADFCGGMDNYSVWIEKADILALFNKKGFDVQEFLMSPDHPNGPCSCFLATK